MGRPHVALLIAICLTFCLVPYVLSWEATKVDCAPAISWGGGLIVFERDPWFGGPLILYSGGSRRLAAITLGENQVLTPRQHVGSNPMDVRGGRAAISPDSRTVAWVRSGYGTDTYSEYARLTGDGSFQNVYITDLRTGRTERLTSGGGTIPAWSPDGGWVAYITPKGQLKAINIETRRTRLLATKMITAEKLAWLPSGPAVSARRGDGVAWYHIEPSGALRRTGSPLRCPTKQGTEPHFAWGLRRDGNSGIYVEIVRVGTGSKSQSRCRVYVLTPTGYRRIAEMADSTYSCQYAGTYPPEVAVSGNGHRFALAIQGGIWKGDADTGHLTRVTKPLY